jgi:hypothetical protein
VRHPDGGAYDTGPTLDPLADEASQAFGKLFAVAFRRLVAVKNRKGQENAPLVVDTAESGVRDGIQTLLATVVGMRTPSNV